MQESAALQGQPALPDGPRCGSRRTIAVLALLGCAALAGCQIKQRPEGVLPREAIQAPPAERRLATRPAEATPAAASVTARERLRLPSDRR